ncbi:MAG: YdcF family protein [Patescibacteria group bacterium]
MPNSKNPSTYQELLDQKEISRNPQVPELSEKDVETIGSIVFASCKPTQSDILFIFGSSDINTKLIQQLFEDGFAKFIIVNGKLGRAYYETKKTIAHLTRTKLIEHGIPDEKIIVQDRSTNTLEDAQFSRQLLDDKKIPYGKILFVCKSHHSGRGYRTLKKVFPKSELSCQTYDISSDSFFVRSGDWWQKKIPRERVYGEYLRIQKYSARGDIAQ